MIATIFHDSNSSSMEERSATSNALDGGGFDTSWAVVIGIDAYRHGIATLRSARADAEAVGRLLVEEHGYDLFLLVDADATRGRLLHLLNEQLPQRVGPNDRVLFYFAGHGVALDGESGPEGYLVPQDAYPDEETSLLAMREVHDALAALCARHLLVVLDCCFAGAFQWYAFRHVHSLPSRLFRQHLESYVSHPARQILTSAAHDQRALDMILDGRVLGVRGDGREHSPFAQALLDGLAGAADASQGGQSGDGVITATELYLYVRGRLHPATRDPEQTPQIWPMRGHGRGEYVFLLAGARVGLGEAPAMIPGNNPFRGLLPFEIEQQDLFFGRGRLVGELRQMLERHRFIAVLGPSGSGKSSLVRAGLVPILLQSLPKHSMVVGPLRPGRTPIHSLASTLAGPLGEPEETFVGDLRERPDALRQKVATFKALTGGTLFVILDQFEELFTEALDASDSHGLIQELSIALQGDDVGLRIVATVRADFEPRFLDTPLRKIWMEGRYGVRPMSFEELREAIEGPAAVRALGFESPQEGSLPELVRRLINDVLQMPGALPLLSFTLRQLYLKATEAGRGDRMLREQDYDDLGTVVGSLRKRADEIYEGLPHAEQATMRRLMLRMGHFEGGQATRRRIPRWEMAHDDGEEQKRIDTVTMRLVEERLIVTGDEPVLGPFVEAAHDALLLGWTRVWDWVKEERPTPAEHRTLTDAVDRWRDDDENPRRLWSMDPGLPAFERRLREAPLPLAQDERRFVAASRARRRWRRARSAAAAVVAAGTVAIAGWFFSRQDVGARSAQARDDWNKAQETRTNDPLRALLLMARAVGNAPESDPDMRLYALTAAHMAAAAPDFAVHLPECFRCVFSDNGHTALLERLSGIAVYALDGARRLPTPLDTVIKPLTFPSSGWGALSADGRKVAVLTRLIEAQELPATLWVWEAETGRLLSRVQIDLQTPADIVFTPGATAVVITGENWKTRIVNLAWKDSVAAVPDEFTRRVTAQEFPTSEDPYSWDRRPGVFTVLSDAPARSLLATIRNTPGDERYEVNFLDASSGSLLGPTLRQATPIVQVRLSPAGTFAAIVTMDGRDSVAVRAWDIRRSSPLPHVFRLPRGVWILNISDDGVRVIVGAVVTGRGPQALEGNTQTGALRMVMSELSEINPVVEVTQRLWTSQDGRSLFLLRHDGEMRVWDTSTGRSIVRLGSLPTARRFTGKWATTPDGQVRVALPNGIVASWDPLRRPDPIPVPLFDTPVIAAAFSPDVQRLALVRQLNPSSLNVQIVTVASRRLGWSSRVPLGAGVQADAIDLQWSADGNYLLTRISDFTSGMNYPYVFTAEKGASICPELEMDASWYIGNHRLVAVIGDGRTTPPATSSLQWWRLPGCVATDSALHGVSPGSPYVGAGGEYYISTLDGISNVHELTSGKVVFSVPFEDDRVWQAFHELFSEASSLRISGDSTVVLRRPEAAVHWSLGEPTGTLSDGRIVRAQAPPYPPNSLHYSPDTRRFVGWIPGNSDPELEALMMVFDASTGFPITDQVWNAPGTAAFALSADGSELWVFAQDGGLRRWPVSVPITRRPEWMKNMGEALTGMRLRGDETEPLATQEHVVIRRQFLAELHQAAIRGDQLAIMLTRRFPKRDRAAP